MKGVIFNTSFFILIIAVIFSLSIYVSFEHNYDLINNNFKKSLQNTAYQLIEKDEYDEDDVLDLLLLNISKSLPKGYEYNFDLLGFNRDPFLMRIKLSVKSSKGIYSFVLEESIIEKEQDDV